MKTIDDIKNKIKSYSKDPNLELIDRAYLLAYEAHGTQYRYSGEAYITHPLEVAYILTELHMDVETVCAALLHDVIEDTEANYEMLRVNYSDKIAKLVDGVTKLEKLQFDSKEEREAENLRKMIVAMSDDIRVIIIKLADRLHNMRTLEHMRPDKQKQKARETLDIYAPLAHRLGISRIKWELEDLSLFYLDNKAYTDIANKIELKRAERETFIENIKEELVKELEDANIEAKVEGRPKHFYSIYKKIKKGKAFEEIYDLFAVRILVNSIKDCYGVLGMVHTKWNPMPGRFKDYIAMPKPNMYQSLHTTVFTKGSEPFEIQIRTYEMHKTAEYGIAAHWKYKEGTTNKSGGNFEERLSWVRELMEMESNSDTSDEFLENIKFDLVSGEVFVFTPQSKVIQLPIGACPIDFAYRIHSDIGNKCIGAKVNGKMVPLTYVLKNGDIVSILTSPNSKGPSRDWLNIVKSQHAKQKIKSFFKKADREENIIRGKDALEKEIKKEGYSLSTITSNEHLDFVSRRFNVRSWEDLYSAIGYGGIKAGLVFQKLKDHFKNEFQKEEKEKEIKLTKNTKTKSENTINVQGYTDLAVFFSNCCNPVPGDTIVGYITKNRGVSIHRSNCINVSNSINRDRLINVNWNNNVKDTGKTFVADMKITCEDRIGLAADISTIVSNEGFGMTNFSSYTDKKYGSITNISVKVHNLSELEKLFTKIKNVKGVKDIYRI